MTANTLILALSENHSDLILPIVEATNVMPPRRAGSQSRRLRAGIVFFTTPAKFSAGSLAWCGSLSHDRHDNDLRRFLDSLPFAGPSA